MLTLPAERQGVLFNDSTPHHNATFLHRRDDHPNSVAAAERMQQRLNKAQEFALQAVKDFPGRTGNELNKLRSPENSPDKVRKRLRELVRLKRIREGETRRCTVTNEPCATWWPVET